MVGAALFFSSLSLWSGAAAMADAPSRTPRQSGFHASLTQPGEAGGAIGYDVGVSSRGRRLLLDLDLSRIVQPYGLNPDEGALAHLEARKTARMSTGVHWSDDAGHTHQLSVRTDRLSWLDLARQPDATAWDHKVAQSFGLAAVYRWQSPDDPRVRSAFHLGGGIRRSLEVDSSFEGTVFDWEPVPAEREESSLGSGGLFDGSSSDAEQKRPLINLGEHRANRSRGTTWTAGARVDLALWPEVVDVRIDGAVEVDQMDAATIAWGLEDASGRTRWTAVTGRARLAARLVAGKKLVVPSVFMDLNASSVPESGTGLVVVPVYGVGLTGGVL